MIRYTTSGPVRGQGPIRDTLDQAERDLKQDGTWCASQGGYSDRAVFAVLPDGSRVLPEDVSLGYEITPEMRGDE